MWLSNVYRNIYQLLIIIISIIQELFYSFWDDNYLCRHYYKDTISTWQPLWTTLGNDYVIYNSLALQFLQWRYVNASVLMSNAHLSATVKAGALITRVVMTSSAHYWHHKIQTKTKQSLWCILKIHMSVTFCQQLSEKYMYINNKSSVVTALSLTVATKMRIPWPEIIIIEKVWLDNILAKYGAFGRIWTKTLYKKYSQLITDGNIVGKVSQ